MAERHRVAAASACNAFELAVILGDFGQRHLRLDDDNISRQRILSQHSSAFGGQISGDIADILRRYCNLDIDYRLQQDRLCVSNAVFKRLPAPRPKSPFLSINGWGFSV